MSWKIDAVSMGSFGLDGGSMFGIIPKPLWQRATPADEKNRIKLHTDCMLLRNGERVVIVEAGNGFDFNDKGRGIYNMAEPISWERALKPFDLTPEDITDVIVSHLHFDHAAGLSYKEAGTHKLSFKNATHYVQKDQLTWAKEPTDKDRGSYRYEAIYPFVADETKKQLLEGEGEVMPGIKVSLVHGHTKAQQLIHVTGETGEEIVFVADLIPTTAHLHIPYIMAYDNNPLETVTEKKRFLKNAVDQDWTLWFYHDPNTTTGKVAFDGKRYRLESSS